MSWASGLEDRANGLRALYAPGVIETCVVNEYGNAMQISICMA